MRRALAASSEACASPVEQREASAGIGLLGCALGPGRGGGGVRAGKGSPGAVAAYKAGVRWLGGQTHRGCRVQKREEAARPHGRGPQRAHLPRVPTSLPASHPNSPSGVMCQLLEAPRAGTFTHVRVRVCVCNTQVTAPISLCSFPTEQGLALEKKRAQTWMKETGSQSLQLSFLLNALGSQGSAQEFPCSPPQPAVTQPSPFPSQQLLLWSKDTW